MIVRLVNGVRIYMSIESAHDQHLIGCFHYQWLRLVKGLKDVLLAHSLDRSSRH